LLILLLKGDFSWILSWGKYWNYTWWMLFFLFGLLWCVCDYVCCLF